MRKIAVEKPKIVVLCGSSRFVDVMAVCAWLISSAFFTANTISFGKEAYDHNKPGGKFDWGDIAADEIGAVGTTAAIALIDRDKILNMEPIAVIGTTFALLGIYMIVSEIKTPKEFGYIAESKPVQSVSISWIFDGDFLNWRLANGN